MECSNENATPFFIDDTIHSFVMADNVKLQLR